MAIWDTFFNNQPSTAQVGMAYDGLAKMYKEMSERDNPILKTIADFNTNLQKGIIDVNNQKVLERLLSINDQDRIDRLNQGKNTWEGYGISPTGGMLYNPKDAAIVAARQKADSDLQNFFGSYITSNAPGTLEDYQAESTDDMLSRLGFTNITPEQKLQAEKKRVANIQNELLGDTSGNTLNRVANGDLNPLDVNQKSFIDDFNQYAQSQGVNPNFISEEAKNKEWSDLNGRLRNPENYEKYITGIIERDTRKYREKKANNLRKFIEDHDVEAYNNAMNDLNRKYPNLSAKEGIYDINKDNYVLNTLNAAVLDQVLNNDKEGAIAKDIEEARNIVESVLGQIDTLKSVQTLGNGKKQSTSLAQYESQILESQESLNKAWNNIENQIKAKYGSILNSEGLNTVLKAAREQFLARTSDTHAKIEDFHFQQDRSLVNGGTTIDTESMSGEEAKRIGTIRAKTSDLTTWDSANTASQEVVGNMVKNAFVKANGDKDTDEGARINRAKVVSNLTQTIANDDGLRELIGADIAGADKAANWILEYASKYMSPQSQREFLEALNRGDSLNKAGFATDIEGKALNTVYIRNLIKLAYKFHNSNRALNINNKNIIPENMDTYNKMVGNTKQ